MKVHKPAAQGGGFTAANILLVEDNATIRRMLTLLLKRAVTHYAYGRILGRTKTSSTLISIFSRRFRKLRF